MHPDTVQYKLSKAIEILEDQTAVLRREADCRRWRWWILRSSADELTDALITLRQAQTLRDSGSFFRDPL